MLNKLIIFMCALNEERNIGEVISRIPKGMALHQEVLVINDGSTDKTESVAKKHGATVISFAARRGLVAAYKKGLEYAISQNADVIVSIDADGQFDPGSIPLLVEPVKNRKADLVIGSRFIKKPAHKDPVKLWGNIAFSKVISALTKTKITDAQSGFRAYTLEVAKALKIQRGYTYTQQMIVQAAYHNFKIIEVPVTEYKRKFGNSRLLKSPFSFAVNAWRLLIIVIATYYPLSFFGTLGIIFCIGGLILGLLTPRLLLSQLIIIIGIQAIFFGIMFKLVSNHN